MKKNSNLVMIVFALCISSGSYANSYCELEGASTDSGEEVTGRCYMHSEDYGELEGAETESGEAVSGECYRHSKDYAELEGAEQKVVNQYLANATSINLMRNGAPNQPINFSARTQKNCAGF